MSDVVSKRQISEVSDPSTSESKRAEPGKEKKGSKPGRKPLETEPKNKRTAQNRAAQRAFRERKERKMKELEERIDEMEQETKSAQTESEFLRLQVQTLMAELAKHRGTTDISDLKLPIFNKNANVSLELNDTSSGSGSEESSTFSPRSSETSADKSQFAFEFPWSRKNSASVNTTRSGSSSAHAPALSSAGSTSSSSGSSPFDLYNADEAQELPMFKKDKANHQEFNFDDNFDEGVSEFCNDLGAACGTKDAPIPKAKSTVSTPVDSKIVSLGDSQLKHSDDPLAFLRDPSLDLNFASFDPSMAFSADHNIDDIFEDNEKIGIDPLNELTTEESMYDPFGMFVQNRSSVSTATKMDALLGTSVTDSLPMTTTTAVAGGDEDNDEVVPSTDGRLLKCTEIWDRITSHPKYADIDIDGLCSELRAKAKCSDKGVVIDYSDVNKVIMNSLPNH